MKWQSVSQEDGEQFLSDANDGHFISNAASTTGLGAQQRSSSRAHPSLGFAMEGGTIEALKSKGMGIASFLREKTSAASESLKQRDWTREQQALSSLKTWGTGAAERVHTATALGWKQAAQGIKAFTGGPLSGICKHEAAERPCPRIVLVCCAALATGGLAAEGLFQKGAPDDLVHFLLGAFEEASGVAIPPPGTSPHVIANALKQFLLTLPEPLLTYKLLPHFIQAGLESPSRAAIIVTELPGPNQNSLQILLETLFRVAANAAENEMDAHALALSVAPCLAWHPPPLNERRRGGSYGQLGQSAGGSLRPGEGAGGWQHAHEQQQQQQQGGGGGLGGDFPSASGGRAELSQEEAGAVVAVIEYLVANFARLSSGDGSPLYQHSMPTTHTLE